MTNKLNVKLDNVNPNNELEINMLKVKEVKTLVGHKLVQVLVVQKKVKKKSFKVMNII